MKTKVLTPQLSSSAQLEVGDLPAVREAGFRSVLCARPDNEASEQPTFATIAEEATKVGLQAQCVPISKAGASEGDLLAFKAAYAALPKPVLGYCASGRRIDSAAATLTQGD